MRSSCLGLIICLGLFIWPSVSMPRRLRGAGNGHNLVAGSTHVAQSQKGGRSRMLSEVGGGGGNPDDEMEEDEVHEESPESESVPERVQRLTQEGSKNKNSAADRYATVTKRKWMKVCS